MEQGRKTFKSGLAEAGKKPKNLPKFFGSKAMKPTSSMIAMPASSQWKLQFGWFPKGGRQAEINLMSTPS